MHSLLHTEDAMLCENQSDKNYRVVSPVKQLNAGTHSTLGLEHGLQRKTAQSFDIPLLIILSTNSPVRTLSDPRYIHIISTVHAQKQRSNHTLSRRPLSTLNRPQ